MAVSGGRDVDPSSVGVMEGAFFVGRTELLDWVNKTFNLRLTKVEQCASGAVYIQILDALYPKQVPMSKVKWDARFDYEYIHNYKIIQSVFSKLDIKKHVEVDKLTRGKYQDNLEFLQWMKAFFDRQSAVLADSGGATANSGSYSGLERRKLAQCTLPDWAKGETAAVGLPVGTTGAATTTSSSTPPPATGKDGSPSKGASVVPSRRVGASSGNTHANAAMQPNRLNSSNGTNRPRTANVVGKRAVYGSQGKAGVTANSTGSPGSAGTTEKASAATPVVAEGADNERDHLIAKLKCQAEQQQAESMARVAEYEEQLQQAVLEKEFYFNKLRQLELMCQEGSVQTFTVEEVQKVLYATDDVEEDEAVPLGETTTSSENMGIQDHTVSPSSAALPLSQQTTSEAATEAPSALSVPSVEKIEGFETPMEAQGLVPMAQ